MPFPQTPRIRLTRRRSAQVLVSVLILAIFWLRSTDQEPPAEPPLAASENGSIEQAFANRRSDVLVTAEGLVSRILADDTDGSRHQRFIVELASGHTVLVAHNIDIAPRITKLQRGRPVAFRGEFEWNDLGGVVHWTHHDPDGVHPGGWVEYSGRKYE
ncbi:MAG: DUF3465 domain-containing protein [Gammaproteobacteria bacterium]|nr:DUF3465 domain-containing protein [Gammaproteobacteria bacterium]